MSDIETRLQNGVLEVHFNRPDKKNAITEAMYTALAEAFVRARTQADVSVVLLTGQKNCFTAGNDLNDFLDHPPEDEQAPVFRFLHTLADFPKPVVAAVNGAAVGIGTTLLLHCDLVFSGESAKFQLPFVNLGLVPEFASSYLLPLRVGHAKAAEWLLTGKTFDAQEAKAAGLINQVFSDEQFLSAALHQAQALAAQPATSLLLTKRLMKQPYMAQTLQIMDEEGELFRRRLNDADFLAAVERFKSR
ncbi:enoyl-CoA hydratase-related protein [Reinekea blandensis]|uniref:Probable enoyl-CoA hydratase/isomerase n=1 Tax=Reinekea blandensis MED297 TaxID=314283 RepID=A4BJV0_9GAMM|nr:enoyl-CoA hydratase-related protein [Reinekea blandensis]EAR07617.1 probable enoyl-CoA hydratase/isomerase [Reinekea sp. MED297] [Reinekea blandensis MED297]